MTDPESLIAQIKQSAHEVSERMYFGGSDYPVKAIPYAKFLEVMAVFEATYRAEVRAGVVTEEPEWEYGVTHKELPGTIFEHIPGDPPATHRRRTAGPWVLVKQEGADVV